eukprot:373174_1
MPSNAVELARTSVLGASEPAPDGSARVRGVDFNQTYDLSTLMNAARFTGFQATNLGLAIEEVQRMRSWRLSDRSPRDGEADLSEEERKNTKATIFLSYTSNMVSCGVRETIKFLVEHNMVQCIVTTAGGIEEDLIKCLANSYIGDFALKGADLRSRGLNRIGNLIIPNENYVKFEDWLAPILVRMTDEQVKDNVVWTPSSMIDRLGAEIDNEDSIYHWAHKNKIPVFCPALVDGSIGDMIYFHKYKHPEFILDTAGDIKAINDIAVHSHASGMIILGGGIVKHHTCNANLMRNGADFSVFINTGSEYDGSDSGARPDEAVSWGKISLDARPVKVTADASLVFPLLVAETFAKDFHSDNPRGPQT